jgi:hypothetical protein
VQIVFHQDIMGRGHEGVVLIKLNYATSLPAEGALT